jgi:hypothetical protein
MAAVTANLILYWQLLLFIELGPLILVQRRLHREVQTIFLLLTRRKDIAIALFSVIFFPGVLLHELSHWLTAQLLGVRTGQISLLPRPMANGRLQMGYVETQQADWVRDALIGAAPLISGGLFVAYAGLYRLGLLELWSAAQTQPLLSVVGRAPSLAARSDFWLLFYLTLVVSSTMLPSASDRRAWLPLALTGGALLAVGLWAGAGPWLWENLTPAVLKAAQALTIVFGVSLFVHLILILPLWILRRGLAWWLRLEVVL